MLPTFIRGALDQYKSLGDSTDAADKYRALEAAYSATIKYVGTTAAVLAGAQCNRVQPQDKDRIWSSIMDSSSLGGWLRAMDQLCACWQALSPETRRYCSAFNDYRKHPRRDDLDAIAEEVHAALESLARKGYRLDNLSSKPSILRSLEKVVEIRNKLAHGSLDAHVLHGIEKPLWRALKRILLQVPFDSFEFRARYGLGSLRLLEATPQSVSEPPRDDFWIECPISPSGAMSADPFAVYHGSSKRIFLLNDKVTWEKRNTIEYIDYTTGDVKYWAVPQRPWHRTPTPRRETGAPAQITESLSWLERTDLTWKQVLLVKEATSELEDEVGVYVFVAPSNLGGCLGDTVLYVGRTRNSMAARLREYLRIRGGYDDSRPELSHMFQSYGDVRLFFASLEAEAAVLAERAIFETARPRYNQIAPSVINNNTVKGNMTWQTSFR